MPKTKMPVKVTVCIVNWNTRGLLKQCLESACRHTKGISFEIIVVDNASDDGSAEMVEKQFPNVVLIKNSENLGFGKAMNMAIRRGRGRFFAIVNSDIVFLNNAIKKMAGFLEKNRHAAVAGCKLFNADMSVQKNLGFFPMLSREAFARIPFLKKTSQYELFDYDKTQEVENFVGACYVVKKEALDDVGLFDEGFFLYVEETDLFYRIEKKGWGLFFLPEAKAIHLGGASTGNHAKVMLKYYPSLLKFFKKHYGWHKMLLLKVICTASCIIYLVKDFSFAAQMIKINLFEW